jgi:putative ABC transport system ATP-binding protein
MRRLLMDFITFENVEREYHVGGQIIKAVAGVSFGIKKGTVNVVLGQSGAGKTTVLNLLGGMDSPTNGRIIVDNREISNMSEHELTTYRRNKIGFVFQFYNLVPNLTVLENVQLAKEICSDSLDSREMLIKVGLENRLENFPSQISGGEQQRVSIARALAKNPQIVLCDEPTGALDSATGQKVLRLICDAAYSMGKTVIIVTHNAAIANMADTIIHMGDGKIAKIEHNDEQAVAEAIVW